MFNNENCCRICLGDGATYNLFDNSSSVDDMHNKILFSLNEKIQYIEGYPSKICIECRDMIEKISDFRKKYKQSQSLLENGLTKLKIEVNLSENETEEFQSESYTKPKVEVDVKNRDEFLASLKEITIKKVTPDNGPKINHDTPPKVITTKLNVKIPRKTCKRPSSLVETSLKKFKLKDNGKNKKASSKGDQINNKRPKELLSEKQPILCDICGATFLRASNLKQHKQTHVPKERFKCDKCHRTYKKKSSLKCHYLKSHEKIRDAICDMCGMTFFEKKNLISHIKVVHEKFKKKPTIYKCRFCDRSFHYKRGIVIHERSVHTGERPEVCKVCHSAFYDIVYLREHMRLHTGDTPFKCPICNRGYAQSGNMKSHMRNHRISELDSDVLKKLKPNFLKFLRP